MYGEAGLCGGLFRGKALRRQRGHPQEVRCRYDHTITGLSGKVIEAQFSGLDHPSTLVWRDCVKTGLLSFKTAENAAEYDELVTLLRQAEVIRKNAAIVEKKLEQYAEYLQFDE